MSSTHDFISPAPPNLPVLMPDETLYSWCARTYLLNGCIGARLFSQQLFDNSYAALAHDIPSRVDDLLSRVPDLGASALEIARRHSVVGFYLPWLGKHRAQLTESHVRIGGVEALRFHLGLPASMRTTLHPLKGCRTCIGADRTSMGIGYWRAEHQLPASWVCTRHGDPLFILALKKPPTRYRQWFLPESRVTCEAIPTVTGSQFETLRRLADFSASQRALGVSSLQPDQLAATYRSALRERGLATQMGSLRITAIVRLVREKYIGLRYIPGFRVLDNISDDWAGFIGNAARRKTKATHPLKHLMLIALLFDRWDDFLETYSAAEIEPRVSPESAPGNDEQRTKRVHVFCELVRSQGLSLSAAGRQVGVSPTTALQWARQNGLNYQRRTKTIDDDVINACRSLLRKGMKKGDVAAQCGVSMPTLTRLLSVDIELRDTWRSAIAQTRRIQNRQRFKALLEKHPGVPIRLLRRIPGNGYAWLYRNDRNWLIENLPSLNVIDEA